MDIQISSNFERALFDALERDAAGVVGLMDDLRDAGGFALPQGTLDFIRGHFDAGRADEQETFDTIRRVLGETGELVDPHTAVGLTVARAAGLAGEVPVVTLATAHPAKFPDAVARACGVTPGLPARLSDILERPERVEILPNDYDAVKAHIETTIAAG